MRKTRRKIRLGATVISVQHDTSPEKSESVSIVYAVGEKLFRVRARSVVMAGGSWTAMHIIRDLPQAHREAYAQFFRSPCLMANVALRNWRFLAKLGMTGCRWFGSGVGNYLELRRLATVGDVPKTISPDSPVVADSESSLFVSRFECGGAGQRGRGEMLATSFRIMSDASGSSSPTLFSEAGFDASRDIAGIVLNRWGHAYLSPQPGFFFGTNGKPAPRDILRAEPFGRIAFANTDLAGAMDHRFFYFGGASAPCSSCWIR